MTVSYKDGFKLLGLAIVCACAVFVCTFFLSYYLDAAAARESVASGGAALYEARLIMAKFVCAISGGVLGLVAVVLTVFYVKLYLDSHRKQMGILKAMGYGAGKISVGFWVFGLSVLMGTSVGFGGGYAVAPVVYRGMGGEGIPVLAVHFHAELICYLVLIPSIVFSALSVLYAWFALRRPAMELLRGRERDVGKKSRKREKERPFLQDVSMRTLGSRKSLVFFVAFACFCFSAMLEMAGAINEYASVTMGAIVFGIGAVLSVVSLILAFTSVVHANKKTVALMRAFGYSLAQCKRAVFGGYRIAAYAGFALGTLYQFGLMKLVLEIFFKEVSVPAYSFDWVVFAAVLAAFLILYECATVLFAVKAGRVSLRELAAE